jgi:hypothetical protein
MNPKVRNVVRDAIRRLKINDGDIVLVKGESRMAQQSNFESFAQYLGKTGRERCIVCVVADFDDLTVLDEAEMNKRGWYHIDEEE